jgi:uncharacterized protein (TIGR03437 family)
MNFESAQPMMPRAVWLLAAVFFGFAAGAEDSTRREAPSYSAASVVNSATNVVGDLAPNTIATVYGVGLSYAVRTLQVEDIQGGTLPTVLPSTGVRVFVGSIGAQLYYVSPTQINFLIPCIFKPGETDLQITLDGHAGPSVRIKLLDTAPAIFQLDQDTVIATRPDGSLIDKEKPAAAGEVIVLYCTGLGPTEPEAIYGALPTRAAPIKRISEFQVFLNDVAVEANRILYAGVTPGYAGLYQVNLRLPENLDADPRIRLVIGNQSSPAGVHLAARANQ